MTYATISGEITNWGNTGIPDIMMSETSSGSNIFTRVMSPSFNGAFRFKKNGDWATNYGGYWNTGLLNPAANNIIAPRLNDSTSYYTLTLDLNTNTFTYAITGDSTLYVEPINWGIVGVFNNWGASPDTLMTETSSESKIYEAVMSTSFTGDFKFRMNNKWTTNYGGVWDTEALVYDGSNIIAPVLPSGSYYTIRLNLNTMKFSKTVTDINGVVSCFNEGTKILCLNKNLQEEYIPIENLRKGDLVKSYLHGYRKIDLIGKKSMVNNPQKWDKCMYKMEKTEENGLLEDLIVTGWHAILVDELGENKKINEKLSNSINSKIDDKYLLLAAASSDFIKIENNKLHTYYHFALETEDVEQQFGVWANCILTETISKNMFESRFL